MIESGYLTHPSANPTFWNWEPSNPVILALLIASLTTILSYQLTALVFDLCLGMKARGSAPVRDIIALLLAEESSLLGVLSAVFRSQTLARWHFHGFRTACPNAAAVRDSRTSHFPVLVPKFLLLLLVPPVVNLVAIVLSLERDENVTFDGANFGGIALGLRRGKYPETEQHMRDCVKFQERLGRLETAKAQFSFCTWVSTVPHETASQQTLMVTLHRRSEVVFWVNTSYFFMKAGDSVDMRVGREVYRVKTQLTPADAEVVLSKGQEYLARSCQGDVLDDVANPVLLSDGDTWSVKQQVRCTFDVDKRTAVLALQTMANWLVLVDAENFEVMVQSDLLEGVNRYTDGGGLLFLKRHKSYVSFTVLAVVTSCITVARIAVKVLTNNDIYIGTDTILKDGMGLRCCDSMLQNKTKVVYKENLRVREDLLSRKMFEVDEMDREDDMSG